MSTGRWVPAPTDAPARLQLLGGFELWVGGRNVAVPARSQRVLAFVALADPPVGRARLVTTLWPNVDSRRAAANLRSALWRLPAEARGLVVADRSHLRLAGVRCDVDEMSERGRRLVAGEDVDELDVEPFLSDLLPTWYDDWVLDERERRRSIRLAALEALSRRLTRADQFAAAIEAALAAIAADPLRETAQRALIEAHLAEGNQHEALRQYERYRDLLAAELAVEPPAEIRRLVRAPS